MTWPATVGEAKLTGAIASVSAFAAELQHLILTQPIVAFSGVGMMGALAGWAFAVETGRLDAARWRGHLCFVARRAVLGVSGGVIVWLAWPNAGATVPASGMLVAGCIGAFPVEIFSRIRDAAQTVVARIAGGKG